MQYPAVTFGIARCAGLLGALVCAWGGHANAQAEPAVNPAAVSPVALPSFVIKGFDVTGDNPLPDADVFRLLAPYLRTDATMDTLQKAVAALEAALKKQGFGQYRVVVSPQDLGNTVSLNVVKFVVGKVTIEGKTHFSEANIRASLPALTEGATPNFRKLATQTAISNESPAKQVQVILKQAREPDTVDARIVVAENKPWNLSVFESNTGTRETGSDRFTVLLSHANLFDSDHQLSAAYSTSLERPQDVRQMGLNYRVPLYRLGGVLSANYTQSDVTGNFGEFSSSVAGKTVGLNYRHFLPPSGGYVSYVSVALDDKEFDVARVNGQIYGGQMVRRTRPFTLGYWARMESSASGWGYNVDWAANVPTGSGNDVLAYQSEDARIRTVNWNAVHGGFDYETGLSNGWLLGFKGRLQYSPDALLSGEQFGLGGAQSVRGVAERAVTGDRGLALSAELTTKELVPGFRALGFVDAGWVSSYDVGTNPYRAAEDRLSSVGVGVRYVLAGLSLSADYAVVLGGSTLTPASYLSVPKAGDSKLHLNVAAHF